MRRRTVAVLSAATSIAAVVAASRRRCRASPRPVSRTSRSARNLQLARIGVEVGSTYASASARKLFASAERREAIDAERQLRTAEQIADRLGQMKGALMKVGQMASYLDDGLPEPVRQALAQLQANAPPMSAELAAGVVTEELGAPPEKLFLEWDPQPIAAASIGQVHRALLRDQTGMATTAGYGPRFLHSTGQLHKGGPPTGWFIQLTSDHPTDRPIPGWPYTLGRLIDAQAQGDFESIESHDLPIARVHLADPDTGLARLEAALAEALRGT